MKNNFDWLKDLKVGDEVAIDEGSVWRQNRYSLAKVEKITPTGRIKLSNGTQYHPSGYLIGNRYKYPLRQVTPEILELIERRQLRYKLRFDQLVELLNSTRLKILLEWQEELLSENEEEK